MDPEAIGPLFSAIGETAYGQVRALVLALAALAALVTAAGLARGRLRGAAAWMGIVVMPTLAFTLGHLALVEDAKRTEFCASCHVMRPVFESLVAGDASIGALHVNRGALPRSQACYGCHSGYGIWGGAGAKARGIEHMLRASVGAVHYPLETYGRYNVRQCLECHAQTQAFRAPEAHRARDVQEALLAGSLGCTGACHPPAHPPEALAGGLASR